VRTTITIDDDLHEVVMALARHNRTSFGGMVGVLVRRGMGMAVAEDPEGARMPRQVDPDTGFPLVRSDRPITEEDVRALEDEP
jgi:hypothetical protein